VKEIKEAKEVNEVKESRTSFLRGEDRKTIGEKQEQKTRAKSRRARRLVLRYMCCRPTIILSARDRSLFGGGGS